MLDSCKILQKQSEAFHRFLWHHFFPSLKQNFIAYRSSKVSSHPDCIFEIHQLWQPGFSRVYSNCCCSCSFETEIIKIGQSPHKMYSNNIVNFQESTTILNACTKSLETYWRHLVCIFPAWPTGTCGFCLCCSGFLGDKFFNLSLTVFGVRIRDLCKSCFVGDFPLLGVVFSWVVDSKCVFPWTTWLNFSLFKMTSCRWVCACRNSAESSFFSRCSFSQSFDSNWISFSTRFQYLLSWLIRSILHATAV